MAVFYKFYPVTIDGCTMAMPQKPTQSITLPFSAPSSGFALYTFTCNLTSSLERSARLNLALDDRLLGVSINGVSIDLTPLKERYKLAALEDWKRGFMVDVALREGANELIVHGSDGGGKYGLRIGQTMGYGAYAMLFVLGIIPIVTGLYLLLFDRIFKTEREATRGWSWHYLAYGIVALGIALRALLYAEVSLDMYQHDLDGHKEAIRYYAAHPFDLPQPDKDLQFPQQPLYYLSSGVVYNAALASGFHDGEAMQAVRALSLLYSALWLLIALALARLYLSSALAVNLFMAFMAFTPSFIFLGGVINNDALNAVLGIWAFYEIGAYLQRRYKRHFWRASLAIALAALTKISSLLLALYFVAVLLLLYYRVRDIRLRIKSEILIFGLMVLLLFGFALIKSHIPANEEFRFVNSALYGNQVIPALDLGYFASFHPLALLEAAQSHVMGSNAVRFSLPTYLYGTMMIGEFDYARHFTQGGFFKLSSQLVLLFGMLYVVGGIGLAYAWRTLVIDYKMLLVAVGLNMVLVVHFLSGYWVVCNSDFRYFTPTIGAIGLLIVLGLEALWERFVWLKSKIIWSAVVLAVAEGYWVVTLIRLT